LIVEDPPTKSPVKTEIAWHRRLEARVLLGIALVVLLSLGAVLFSANRVVTEYARSQALENLRSAQTAFKQLTQDRIAFFASPSQLIAEEPAFQAHLTNPDVASDVATVNAMAEHYRGTLQASFLIATDAAGRWMGEAGWPRGVAPPKNLLDAIQTAREGQFVDDALPLNGRLYLFVSEPARFAQQEVIGTLTAGYPLDDQTAKKLASISQCDVNFIARGRLVGSSLPADERKKLAAHPPSQAEEADAPSLLRLDQHAYLSDVFPFFPGKSSRSFGYVLLLQDWRPTRRFLIRVESALLEIGLAAVLVSLAGSLIFSRWVTRPLSDMAETAEAIAEGNWDRRAKAQGAVETKIMADAFNHMTSSLNHYYRQARLQTERVEETLGQLQDSYSATLYALSRALDARDNETEGHSQRVTNYALRLARHIAIDDESLETLKLGALLHDIGKIGVPDAILRKPGRLTDEEMEIMRRHCQFGLEIVQGISYLEPASTVIRCHHERFDGGGYPNGLAGEEIPLIARIFSVADTLDAMTSDRPYRKARPFPEALAEIQRCSGSQFDPQVVAALESLAAEIQS
jgi:putative nucleotidyltransferase with HDIG domain